MAVDRQARLIVVKLDALPVATKSIATVAASVSV
jgi:hypothetical protein